VATKLGQDLLESRSRWWCQPRFGSWSRWPRDQKPRDRPNFRKHTPGRFGCDKTLATAASPPLRQRSTPPRLGAFSTGPRFRQDIQENTRGKRRQPPLPPRATAAGTADARRARPRPRRGQTDPAVMHSNSRPGVSQQQNCGPKGNHASRQYAKKHRDRGCGLPIVPRSEGGATMVMTQQSGFAPGAKGGCPKVSLSARSRRANHRAMAAADNPQQRLANCRAARRLGSNGVALAPAVVPAQVGT